MYVPGPVCPARLFLFWFFCDPGRGSAMKYWRSPPFGQPAPFLNTQPLLHNGRNRARPHEARWAGGRRGLPSVCVAYFSLLFSRVFYVF